MSIYAVEKLITSGDIDEVISLIRQRKSPLFTDDIFDFLTDQMLCSVARNQAMQCPHCHEIYIGIGNMALHIKEKHLTRGVYYKDMQLNLFGLSNIGPSDPPNWLYFCAYCGFPTSDAHGRHPGSDMDRHIQNECPKAPPPPKKFSCRTSNDPIFIKECLSKKEYINAKICTECEDKIFGTEESAIIHYLQDHSDESALLVDTHKIRDIFKDPIAYIPHNVAEFEKVKNEAKEYVISHKAEIEIEIKNRLEKHHDLAHFINLWLLKDMVMPVDINKTFEELSKYSEGLPTDSLTYAIFNEKSDLQKFSLCYTLQQHSNFVYDLPTDTWKISPELLKDSPDDPEILLSKRSPVPHIRSKIPLEDEYGHVGEPSYIKYKEMDMNTWERIKKDEIFYILFFCHIYSGYLPYDEKARKLFPPNRKRVYFITDNRKKIQVKIDKNEKAIFSNGLKEFFKDTIAGMVVYLRRLDSDSNYKIYFKENPQIVRDCRIAKYDEENKIMVYEKRDIEVKYECMPPIFKAELRFKDLGALWAEAKIVGYSISDLVYIEFSELAKQSHEKTAHFNDIYGHVFFKRMCSPGGVWSVLKSHPSYYEYQGNKIWKLIKEGDKPALRIDTGQNQRSKRLMYFILTVFITALILFMLKIIIK